MEIYKERQPISMPPAGVLLDVYCSCMFLELLALMKGSFLFLCMCQYSAYTHTHTQTHTYIIIFIYFSFFCFETLVSFLHVPLFDQKHKIIVICLF